MQLSITSGVLKERFQSEPDINCLIGYSFDDGLMVIPLERLIRIIDQGSEEEDWLNEDGGYIVTYNGNFGDNPINKEFEVILQDLTLTGKYTGTIQYI